MNQNRSISEPVKCQSPCQSKIAQIEIATLKIAQYCRFMNQQNRSLFSKYTKNN